MRLDHLAYAAGPEGLASTVQRLGAELGGGFTDGGLHPRFGTRNFVLPLAGGIYLEVVGHLDHPSTDAEPFGQAVKRRSQAGGGWLGWVVSVDDIAPVEERLGRRSVHGNRRRPDGFELTWRQIGVLDLIDDPQLPFFIQWQVGAADHPSAPVAGKIALERVEIAGEQATVEEWLGAPVQQVFGEVGVSWIDSDEQGIVAAEFSTPNGTVRID